MFSCPLEASDVTARFPDAFPPLVGAKTMPKVRLCPAVSVIGGLSPLTENAALESEVPEIVRFADPVLLTTAVAL